jgi:thiosulfate/3-mercaptopyruvate sulfurtransferase
MREPEALISTAQLADALRRPDLRVYDCTTYLEPPPPGHDDPYIAVPGLRTFEEAHVPAPIFSICRASSPIRPRGSAS